MRSNLATVLDPNRRSNDAGEFEAALRRRIVGQDQAVEKVAEIYQMFLAGLNAPGRPVGNLLFLGPTGSGKTRVVEAMAESLFGDSHAHGTDGVHFFTRGKAVTSRWLDPSHGGLELGVPQNR